MVSAALLTAHCTCMLHMHIMSKAGHRYNRYLPRCQYSCPMHEKCEPRLSREFYGVKVKRAILATNTGILVTQTAPQTQHTFFTQHSLPHPFFAWANTLFTHMPHLFIYSSYWTAHAVLYTVPSSLWVVPVRIQPQPLLVWSSPHHSMAPSSHHTCAASHCFWCPPCGEECLAALSPPPFLELYSCWL